MQKIIVETENDVIQKLTEEIGKIANEAIILNGKFRIGLSGGSLVKYLCAGLPLLKTDWTKWTLYFCDERYVPEDDSESTFGTYKRDLIPKTSLEESQFATINLDVPLEECAKDYEERIRKEFQVKSGSIPKFDLLLLGMGPDGHTCSLFPGHKLLQEDCAFIAPIDDSPKPPPQRITMTFPLINNANFCIFAMSGSGKAEMVKRVFVDNDESLPAAMVKPKSSHLKCILDKEAGKYLV